MGLDIDEETGEPFRDQGTFQNSRGAHGKFRNGLALPRREVCRGCERPIVEEVYGQGFRNCGALEMGTLGAHMLCADCLESVIDLFDKIATAIRGAGSGIAFPNPAGPYGCWGCGADLTQRVTFRCGALNTGPRGRYNLCDGCNDRALEKLPGVREAVS